MNTNESNSPKASKHTARKVEFLSTITRKTKKPKADRKFIRTADGRHFLLENKGPTASAKAYGAEGTLWFQVAHSLEWIGLPTKESPKGLYVGLEVSKQVAHEMQWQFWSGKKQDIKSS